MERKIVFVGGLFPSDEYCHILKDSIGIVQYAADALQKSILEGLTENNVKYKVFNLPFIGAYPIRYKKLFFNVSKPYISQESHDIINVSFCNLLGYKLYSRFKHLRANLLHEFANTKQNTDVVILIYSIHTPFLKACVDLKRVNKNVKIVQIVPDLPEFMCGEMGMIRNFFEWCNKQILEKLYTRIDGYVLLSEFMNERLPIAGKPMVVMEGIYKETASNDLNFNSQNEKYILYTGTLAHRYGVMNLVNAFLQLNNKDVKLYICGDGDSKEEIIKYARKNKNIKYWGQVDRNKAIELQRSAVLLVNPRTGEGDFTKYSFPSKTMEYLGSGVPTLLYKLPGIPEEYYRYCFTLDDSSIHALAEKIDDILSMDMYVLREIGKSAREFILREKTPRKQVSKIVDLIYKI